MSLSLLTAEFRIERDDERCIACQVCVRQCANDVHAYDAEDDWVYSDDARCVGCHRCVTLCPTHALTIRRNPLDFRPNANWIRAAHHQHLQAGRDGRHAADRHGLRPALADLLRPPAAERLAGDQPLHRPAARADGAAHLPRAQARPGRSHDQGGGRREIETRAGAPAHAGDADHVLGHVLWLDQLQRLPVAGPGGQASAASSTTRARAGCTPACTSTGRTPSPRWPRGALACTPSTWRSQPRWRSRSARGPSRASAATCRAKRSRLRSRARA